MSTESHLNSTPASRKSLIDHLNREFELLLTYEDGKFQSVFWRQINQTIWFRLAYQAAAVIFVLLTVGGLTFYVPQLNWTVSAIGRITLIQMLPYWDWTSLHLDQCLIEKTMDVPVPAKPFLPDSSCDFCESIDNIPRTANIGAVDFETFIRYHQPFLVQQTHRIWSSTSIREFLLNTTSLTSSIPCDVQTNVRAVRGNRVYQLFADTLDSSKTSHVSKSPSWFLTFRNCEFAATKSLRPLWPRPDFISPHLRPSHTSWLIVSHEYFSMFEKSLEVRGLAAVAQLTGRRKLHLVAAECGQMCVELSVDIWAGETLVFIAEKWSVRYELCGDDNAAGENALSVTYVVEFDWDPSRW